MPAGGVSHSAFNLAEHVPVRRITPSVRANLIRYTRVARSARALHRSVVGGTAKQEDKPRRRFGQLRQRERLSLSNHRRRAGWRGVKSVSEYSRLWCLVLR